MSFVRTAAATLSVLAIMGATPALAAAPAKKIGFAVRVMTRGLTKTTVDAVVVSAVTPNSQAAEAGVAVGDSVARIETTVVPGASVFALKPHMEFKPGVPKTVTFKRANGTPYDVTFVRAATAKGDR